MTQDLPVGGVFCVGDAARFGMGALEVLDENTEPKAGRTGVVEEVGTTSGLAKMAQSTLCCLG